MNKRTAAAVNLFVFMALAMAGTALAQTSAQPFEILYEQANPSGPGPDMI